VLVGLLPGSIHFLGGHRKIGFYAVFGCECLHKLTVVLLIIPGILFVYIAYLIMGVYIVFWTIILVSSWRQSININMKLWKWLLVLFFILGLNGFLLFPYNQYIADHIVEITSLAGPSMHPTFAERKAPLHYFSDGIAWNKLIYNFDSPKRGDIVLWKSERKHSNGFFIMYVKRVVGLPGETVDVESPFILINGKRLTDPPIFEEIATGKNGYSGYFKLEALPKEQEELLPITLGTDEYFLMGDNSKYSVDSRHRGPVHKRDIVGKAVRVIFPFSRIRELK